MILTVIFLTIELLDELIGGILDPAWPLIRQDLNLSYGQMGLLLALPNIFGTLIEPILGIWVDMGHRQRLIIAGGLGVAIALIILSLSPNFAWLLIGLILLNPASGSFVNVAQATFMDLALKRHERHMALWTLAGSIGNVMGPLILMGAIALSQGWRTALFVLATSIGLLSVLLWQCPILWATTTHTEAESHSFSKGIHSALSALKRPHVVRWLTLLQFSDLMLDVFRSFVALYFVDVVGSTPTQASFAFTLWLGFGLLGDFLLIPLLTKVRGLTYLKISVTVVLFLYPAFLAIPSIQVKYVILACLGFLNAGWYSILKGQLYTAMPGQSGAVITLSNLFGIAGGLAPLVVGGIASQFGLETAMGLLIVSPVALLMGLSR